MSILTVSACCATLLPFVIVTSCVRELAGLRTQRTPAENATQLSLESPAEQSDLIVGGTCYSMTRSGNQSRISAKGACKLLYLPGAQLIYVRMDSQEGTEDHLVDVMPDNVWRMAYQDPPNYSEIAMTWTDRFLPPDSKYFGKILLFHPPGKHLEADKEVRRIVDSVTALPRHWESPTVHVDFDAPCHSEANWPGFGARGNGSIQVYWLGNAHHVNVVASHMDEEMMREDLVQNINMQADELDSFLEMPVPESFVTDSPPPSCYIDPNASPDCAHYEPHVSELRNFLTCFGVPTATVVEQKIAADLLRQLLFHLRSPISPKALAVAAATSLWRSFTRYATELPGRSKNMPFFMEAWPMPGHAAKCLGLNDSFTVAGPRVAAIACYLPMSSVTGFGMTYQGTSDETSYQRVESMMKGAAQATGWREPSLKEKARGYHGNLISPTNFAIGNPGIAIASIDAPSMCARIVFDRLRRLSFLPYNNKAWFGREHEPVNSLRPADLAECIQARRSAGNCRYYAGCVLRLLADFGKIPGLSREAVEYCAAPSRRLHDIDSQWMETDNRYWMRLGRWDVSRPLTFFQRFNFAKSYMEPPGIAGFFLGDVVRIHKPANGVHDHMYVVDSLGQGAAANRLCLRRGDWRLTTPSIHCFRPENLRHVSASGWRLEVGTGIPIAAESVGDGQPHV